MARMSHRARLVIAHIDQGELHAEVAHWNRYAHCLTPQERQRLGSGNYHALRRPHRPSFGTGDWLPVGPKFDIRIADVQPKRGGYRIRIDKVRDLRTHHVHMPHYREDLDLITTLDVRHNANPPEPEGVDDEWLKRYADDAELRTAHLIRETIEG